MQIVIPMAGNGQRFFDAGYDLPKPMIDVLGKPMIQRVLENLDLDGKYHFIVKKEHQTKYGISNLLKSIIKDCEVLEIDQTTEGAACTTLLAVNGGVFNLNDSLIVTNCDQIFKWNKDKFLDYASSNAGTLLCHKDSDSKWSYCIGEKQENETLHVHQVVEKPDEIPNPPYANVGLYHWSNANTFLEHAERMIMEKNKVKNEYYIAPVYNYLCLKSPKTVGAFLCEKMWGIGIPEDLQKYEAEFNLD